MRTFNFLLACLVLALFSSCSDQKADYEAVQKIQDASELTIQRTSDYDIKGKACDDAISSLQAFLSKHSDGDLANAARTALASWQSRKASFQNEINALSKQLVQLMINRATELADQHHPLSKIEKIDLANRQTNKDGSTITVNDSYALKMRGKIIGRQVFNFTVKVSGHISTDKKVVAVDKSSLEE